MSDQTQTFDETFDEVFQEAPLDLSDPLAVRRQTVTEKSDNPDAHLAQVVLDIDQLLELGTLVDPSFHGASMFDVRAPWASLGIDTKDKGDPRTERLKRGRMLLLPAKQYNKIKSLEVRFRQSVRKYGRQITGFGGWWWIPYTAYDEWIEEWERLDEQLTLLKQDIIANRDKYIDALLKDVQSIALRAWRSIAANRDDPTAADFAVIIGNRAFENRDVFADYLMAQVVEEFPTEEHINVYLYAEYRNGMLVTNAEQVLQHQTYKAEADADKAEADARKAKAKAEQKEFFDRMDIAEAEKKARIEAMHQAELERAREVVGRMVSPIQEVMEQLEAELYDTVVKLAESITKNGHVRGKVASKARDLLSTYRTLSAGFTRDELDGLLEKLSVLLDPDLPSAGDSKYDTEKVLLALRQIQNTTSQSATDIITRRTGRVSVADALEL